MPQLRRLFEGDDEVLQWNCLCHLVPLMPEECVRALAPDLRRFRGPVCEGVDEEFDMRELVDEVLEGVGENVEGGPVKR